MGRWYRTTMLSESDENPKSEFWEYRPVYGKPCNFDVKVTVGKSFDVLALKGADLDSIRGYASSLSTIAERLYGTAAEVSKIENCPICRTNLVNARAELRIFDVVYVRCPACRHVLVEFQPAGDALERVFVESEEHSSTYVDRDAIEIRMNEIIAPKLDWCLACYKQQFDDIPQRILDVGAGGGHFLAGARNRGYTVNGFEKSRVSRSFAHEVFGLKLREDDFLTADMEPVDCITFWGLLEYVPKPRDFLAKAHEILVDKGMLIVEVPRVDALGTLVQSLPEAIVARHMDPTSHVNGFSDESLCTALVEEGFAPVAAWYFGMDAWETLIQIAFILGDSTVISDLGEVLPVLQKAVDRGRQCDDIVVAAIPISRNCI